MWNRWSANCCVALFILLGLAGFAPAVGPRDAEALAQRIDELLAVRLREKGVPPAPLADDAAFIRRVYLDLAGCIPSIIDVRDFLDDPRPDKRRVWVDLILEGHKPSRKPEAFAQHFANVWRAWILARVNNAQAMTLAPALEIWLREQLKTNTPYDRLVRDLIAAQALDNNGRSSGIFYRVNEFKPENLAASASRLFLGIKLECAQCHDDRSGGSWTREQFWSFAAFFAGVNPQGNGADKRKIDIPGKKKTVRARFLDDREPLWKNGDNPRAVLADWLVSAKNPYFARAAVNRLWAYFFGVGLTDPLDEQGTHNPPSHPELLDELASRFIENNFDLKYLISSLVASRAYQRGCVASHSGQNDPRLFARAVVRGLSAEQLFDSLAEATEYQDNGISFTNRPASEAANLSPRQEFLARFAHQDKPTEAPTSILQALYLMNGSFVAERTSLEQNKTLATLADQSGSDSRRLESLFLTVLSRKPTAAESKRFRTYYQRGGPSGDRRKALADIFWVLLNSAEFRLNH